MRNDDIVKKVPRIKLIVNLDGYLVDTTSPVDDTPNLSRSFKDMFHDEIAPAGNSTRHGATIAYNIELTPAICTLIGRDIQATWNSLLSKFTN